jgi:hypothetical protein
MRKIAILCVFFIIIMLAIVGCMTIFDLMSFDSAVSVMLKFGGAIVLLGACAAALTALIGGKTDPQD